MTHRLYQLIAECEFRETELLRTIVTPASALHKHSQWSAARTLQFRIRYYPRLQDIFWELEPAIGSSAPFELDALLSSIDRDSDLINALLDSLEVLHDDCLRPSRLRWTIQSVLRGSTLVKPRYRSPRTEERVEAVEKVLQEFKELLALEITRNDLRLVEHLEKNPSMLISQALKRNGARTRVKQICNELGKHNLERAYEIVGICEGNGPEIIRKTYSRVNRTSTQN
jgi:hypothetical protein